MKKVQLEPVGLERLIQGRSSDKKDARDRSSASPSRDDTLEAAVARMTERASAKGHPDLVASAGEWQSLVLKHLAKTEISLFIQEVFGRLGSLASEEDLQTLAGLTMNILNNTPQPDRGGRTANHVLGR